MTLDNALLAIGDPAGAPDPSADAERCGAWVENACLAHAWSSGQHVAYWREEPLEVDAVIDGSWGKWAIEVKTGGVQPSDLRGLFELTRRYPAYRPLVLCDPVAGPAVDRIGIPWLDWRDFLLDGPSAAE